MDSQKFSTHPLRAQDQRQAWAEWFQPVFDVQGEDTGGAEFIAEYSVWNFGDVALTWVSAPAARTVRTTTHLRRSPMDHWVISYSRTGTTTVATNGLEFKARPGVPFVWSLGQPSDSSRAASERLQLYLPRDSFSDIAGSLDNAIGSMLDTGSGQLLADYLLLLKRSLPNLTPDEAARLPQAIRAMAAACVAPSADRSASALPQIQLAILEKVRRAVSRNLYSPSLAPDKLCRETAMSRSQLYRVLESEGGVTRYIQHRRLSQSFAILSDVSNDSSIADVGASLCFHDPSSFTRAFKREFGVTPMDVRASSRSGVPAAQEGRKSASRQSKKFLDCLRSF